MVSSAFYFSDHLPQLGECRSLVFVLGSHEYIQAEMLIEQAVQKGASVIVMAREHAGAYRQLCQRDLRPGVSYIFSRSVMDTLRRLKAQLS